MCNKKVYLSYTPTKFRQVFGDMSQSGTKLLSVDFEVFGRVQGRYRVQTVQWRK